MADVRALLAAERQSRRIKHPALTYTKSGALICNVCQLNVKSESLWDGHLRSANHKKNAKSAEEAASRSLKRRRDDDEDEQSKSRPNVDLDRRKIPKSRAASLAEKHAQVTFQEEPEVIPDVPIVPLAAGSSDDKSRGPEIVEQVQEEAIPVSNPADSASVADEAVDEDEWAAFERDIAPLAQTEQPARPDYSGTTISAAPVSAAQLAEQQAEEKKRQSELTAEDEQEDERGRMEEEFEIMEEMEEKVRKLKEMREKLRAGGGGGPTQDVADDGEGQPPGEPDEAEKPNGELKNKVEGSEEEEEDDSDLDDWYR